jgi:hypothetical protein
MAVFGFVQSIVSAVSNQAEKDSLSRALCAPGLEPHLHPLGNRERRQNEES